MHEGRYYARTRDPLGGQVTSLLLTHEIPNHIKYDWHCDGGHANVMLVMETVVCFGCYISRPSQHERKLVVSKLDQCAFDQNEPLARLIVEGEEFLDKLELALGVSGGPR